MTQQVAVITGASSGLGKETARALLAQGWHVIALGRDPARTATAKADLCGAAQGDARLDMIRADFSMIAEVDDAAAAIAALTARIDVLVNNAGGMAATQVVTREGLGANFAGNHLGPFALTNHLLPLIRATARDAPTGTVRIVNTASDGSEMIPGIDWDDLQLLGNFVSGRAYCQGKLANVMHARALAARLAGDGIVVHALHPGTISSNFISHADAATQAHIRTRQHITSRQGADALVWLATAEVPGRSTGNYYHQREIVPPNPVALDDAQVERLWTESERLVASARLTFGSANTAAGT